MHEHAGAQTPPHTSTSAFLLTAEVALAHACTEASQAGNEDIRNEAVDLMNKVYQLRLKEISA